MSDDLTESLADGMRQIKDAEARAFADGARTYDRTVVERLTTELVEARDEITRLTERLQDSWYVDIGERLDAALAEVARLRQGIERHRNRQNIGVAGYSARPSDVQLWSLLRPLCPSCGDNGDCGETAVECGDEFHGNGEH